MKNERLFCVGIVGMIVSLVTMSFYAYVAYLINDWRIRNILGCDDSWEYFCNDFSCMLLGISFLLSLACCVYAFVKKD